MHFYWSCYYKFEAFKYLQDEVMMKLDPLEAFEKAEKRPLIVRARTDSSFFGIAKTHSKTNDPLSI